MNFVVGKRFSHCDRHNWFAERVASCPFCPARKLLEALAVDELRGVVTFGVLPRK